jgi:hypothetical protein
VASSTGFLDHGQLMVTFSDHDGAQLLARRARRNYFGGELVSADTLLVEWRIPRSVRPPQRHPLGLLIPMLIPVVTLLIPVANPRVRFLLIPAISRIFFQFSFHSFSKRAASRD